MNLYAYIYTHSHRHVHIHMYIFGHTTSIFTYKNRHIHTYTHTYIFTHTFSYAHRDSGGGSSSGCGDDGDGATGNIDGGGGGSDEDNGDVSDGDEDDSVDAGFGGGCSDGGDEDDSCEVGFLVMVKMRVVEVLLLLLVVMVEMKTLAVRRTYVFAFLLGSRLFTKPQDLFSQICQICICQQNLGHDRVKKESLGRFGPNFVRLLSHWTDLYPHDFLDERMQKTLKDISQRIVTVYPELRKEVANIMQNLYNELNGLKVFDDYMSKVNAESLQKSQNQMVPTTDIIDVCPDPLTLAQQLTNVELDRFSHIGAEEFVCACVKDSINGNCTGTSSTSHLEIYIQWFNRLSYFVATEICSHLKKKKRVCMIDYFIDVAKECINIGNFNSLVAIIAGMNMSPVARLKKTLYTLSLFNVRDFTLRQKADSLWFIAANKNTHTHNIYVYVCWAKINKDKFSILEHQMDPTNNFSSYRLCLKAAKWRSEGAVDDRERVIVPFFSLFVKDIYFLNEGFSNRMPNGNINFEKFWLLAKRLSEFVSWQKVECPYAKKTDILSYILTTPIYSETDGLTTEVWRASGCSRLQSDLARFLQLDALPNANQNVVGAFYMAPAQEPVRQTWNQPRLDGAFYVPLIREPICWVLVLATFALLLASFECEGPETSHEKEKYKQLADKGRHKQMKNIVKQRNLNSEHEESEEMPLNILSDMLTILPAHLLIVWNNNPRKNADINRNLYSINRVNKELLVPSVEPKWFIRDSSLVMVEKALTESLA
uniref:Ras-GEF domain-containing protein n=1 Tax=Octopus bimaculoides TaxID=37653 RepID=A0A0L8GTA3_OCTBM